MNNLLYLIFFNNFFFFKGGYCVILEKIKILKYDKNKLRKYLKFLNGIFSYDLYN